MHRDEPKALDPLSWTGLPGCELSEVSWKPMFVPDLLYDEVICATGLKLLRASHVSGGKPFQTDA